MADITKKETWDRDWIGERFKNVADNNWLLEEDFSTPTDIINYLIMEVNYLRTIIAQHQQEEKEYEKELVNIIEEV